MCRASKASCPSDVTPVLHDWELSADCYAVRLGAALMGVALERRGVDAHPGDGLRAPAFRRLNPMGTLPVLAAGELTLTSVAGALAHLAPRGGGWLPDPPGACLDWLAFAAGPLACAEQARMAALLEMAPAISDPQARARKAFRALDRHLAHRGFAGLDWLAADRPTIADVAAFPAVALAVDWGETLEDFPPLRAWTRRLRALPGFIAMPGVPALL